MKQEEENTIWYIFNKAGNNDWKFAGKCDTKQKAEMADRNESNLAKRYKERNQNYFYLIMGLDANEEPPTVEEAVQIYTERVKTHGDPLLQLVYFGKLVGK
jgi:hypothetical protein